MISSGQSFFNVRFYPIRFAQGQAAGPDLRRLFIQTNGREIFLSKRFWCQVQRRDLTYADYSFRQMEEKYSWASVFDVRSNGGTWPTPIICSDNQKKCPWAGDCDVRFKCGIWPTSNIHSEKYLLVSRRSWCQVEKRNLTYENRLMN